MVNMSPLSKKSKKLIVSGCSYTDDCHDYPAWPELLAKRLKMDCINLGSSGAGNEYISSSLLDTISEHKNIGLVIAMWSEFLRLDFYSDYTPVVRHEFNWAHMHFPREYGTVDRHQGPFGDWKNKIMRDLYKHGFGSDKANLIRSLRIFFMFQQTIKSLNIPFLQLMGTNPLSAWGESPSWAHRNKAIIDSSYLKLIDKKLFLGWPIMPQIGGWNIDSFLDEYEYEEVRISLDDCHPNAKGHSLIAKKLYKYYENIYGTVSEKI